jgi:CxxC motif-containing protein
MMGDDGEILLVTGNTCPRGESYARKEVTAPTRIVTSSVRVYGSRSGERMVSLKTASDIPKDRIMDVIRDLRGVAVPAPVRIGDVLLKDVAGTGVDMIATKNVD